MSRGLHSGHLLLPPHHRGVHLPPGHTQYTVDSQYFYLLVIMIVAGGLQDHDAPQGEAGHPRPLAHKTHSGALRQC